MTTVTPHTTERAHSHSTTAAATTSTSESMDVAALRAELTDKYSTERFAIEYGGYLSNHLLHGAVALFEIGATRAQIEDFASHYAAEKLVAVAPDHVDPFHVEAVESSSDSNTHVAIPNAQQLELLLGQREDFDALLAFYGHEVQLLGADAAVQKHLPSLVAGLCGALLHGLIQLGYAFHIGGDRLIAEGLAYMHFSYLSFESNASTTGNPATTTTTTTTTDSETKQAFTRDAALHAVHALKHHDVVLSEMRAQLERPAVAELSLGLFQRKLNAISAHPQRGSAKAFDAVADALAQFDLSELCGDVAIDFALWLYTMIAHNDFVITHAVTSAWSLQQLEHLLDAHDRARAWRVWLHVAVSAFVLQEVRDLRVDDICDEALTELSALESWNDILARARALEGYPDEHVYKLVQVAHEHATGGHTSSVNSSADNSKERSRFLTPEQREFVARTAATKVVALEFERI